MRTKIQRVKKEIQEMGKKVLIGSGLITLVAVGGGLINFVFQLLISSILPPEDFGLINPILAFLSVVGSLLAGSFQVVIAKDAAPLVHLEDQQPLRRYFRKSILAFIIFASVVIVLLLIGTPAVKFFFHLTDLRLYYLGIAFLIFYYAYAPLMSLLQARERFVTYSVSQMIIILVKFAVGLSLVIVYRSIFGVLLGLLVSQAMSFLFCLVEYFLFTFGGKRPSAPSPAGENEKTTRDILRGVAIAIPSVGGSLLLNYLDPMLARHYLSAIDSGTFSAASLLGKAMYYIASGLSFVLLPYLANNSQKARRTSLIGIALLFLALAAYAGALGLFGNFIADVLFRGRYPGLGGIIPIYAVAFLPYAVASFLLNYYVIQGNWVFSATLLGGAALQTLLVHFFHGSILQVCIAIGAAGYLILALLLIDMALIAPKKESHA